MKKNAGNMLAIFLGILLLATIILPLVIQLLQTESKQSVNHQKSTVAFQLAEAAVAKGVAKLTESRKNWTDAVAGTELVGYNDDVSFSDIPGGKYKIKFSTGSTPGTVLVLGKGMDSSSKEVRSVEAEYSGADPRTPALIFDQGRPWPGGSSHVIVHWGSVLSFGNLAYYAEYGYPRLYSAGSVQYRDTDSSPPNTDNKHYWAYQTDLGSPPVPDLPYYKQKAMNSIFPSSTTTGEIRHADGTSVPRNPPNSGYFQSSLNPGKNVYIDKKSALLEGMGNLYEYHSSTSVLYFDNDHVGWSWLHIDRAFLDVEAVINTKSEIDIGITLVPYYVYGATIPETAPYEYQGTSVYYSGYPTGQTVWNTTFSGVFAQPNHCCYSITNPQIHGYLYSDMIVSGYMRVVGVVQQNNPDASMSSSYVYYDPNVAKNISWAKTTLHRLSWKETSHSW